MQFQESQQAGRVTTHPTVFLSYTHDTEEHCQAVLEFAGFLKGNGITVLIDRWAGVSRRDWQLWSQRNIPGADYIIVVASEVYRRVGDGDSTYDRNRGGQWEVALLRDALQENRPKWTEKILPVILPGHGIDGIPRFLQPHAADRYEVTSFTVAGAEPLLRVLTGQPGHIAPPLGPLPHLPPRSGPGAKPT
ncbi:toll/interleukin-1 receptor domain-containing protein [Amycolatopsis samaneae]|uniref:Toll/interleukin-1 receptor domain-containing protein n=1 Tax=Amycolatopsis samaneae TaxID=664691 RepID=A0ABW5G9H3_9PSEU